jgi:hypothetical protein
LNNIEGDGYVIQDISRDRDYALAYSLHLKGHSLGWGLLYMGQNTQLVGDILYPL